MGEETQLLKKRFCELARRADEHGYYTFTDFLGLAEQSAFDEVKLRLKRDSYTAFGGCEGAERVMIRFGNPDEIGYEQDFPIACILIRPRAERFAERLTHRDFLGSLMSLGIERDKLGDIIIRDGQAYLFSDAEIASYIADSLNRVRNTDVGCTLCDALPKGELYRTEEKRIQLSSERIDAVVAKAFNLSRDDAQALFKRGLVFVEGRLCESLSYTPKSGERITVRTYGRLIYRGAQGLTRKGKLNVTVELYV